MNSRDLDAFVAVVETGSIVGAAQRLHLTQPGITRRVQSLESALGLTLLDRQSKPLKPTSAGHEVYAASVRVLNAVADLRALGTRGVEPVGEFRLGVPPFLSEHALTGPVDRLRATFPRLTLRVTAGWSPGLLSQVERFGLDAAAVLLPDDIAPPPELAAFRLARQPTWVVAAKSLTLPKPKGGRLRLAALAEHAWVLNQDGCGMRSAMHRAMEAQRLPFHVALEAFGAELQLSLVARGMGLGLVTPDVLARSAYRDAVRVVRVDDFDTGVAAWLVHGTLPRRLEAPAALLRELLVAQLGGAARTPPPRPRKPRLP